MSRSFVLDILIRYMYNLYLHFELLGLKIAKGAIDKTPIGKYVPTSMDFTSKPNPGSQGDFIGKPIF